MQIPFLSLKATNQIYESQIAEIITKILNQGWYILGERLSQFESEFAQYCGVKHCIGVANGLDALTILLKASEFPPNSDSNCVNLSPKIYQPWFSILVIISAICDS